MDQKLHVTVQHGQSLLLLEKCVQCCSLYHCPFCKPEVFKPTVRYKLQKHIEAHKKRALQYKGYTIYKCNLACSRRPHFHCCGCSSLIEQRRRLVEHLLKCEGALKAEFHPVSENEVKFNRACKEDTDALPVCKEDAGGLPMCKEDVDGLPVCKKDADGHHVCKEDADSLPVCKVMGHHLTLLPALESEEPADHSYCETISSDIHLDEDLDPRSRVYSAGAATGGSSGEGPAEDIKALYRRFLLKEIENRDQEMAYRLLKMRKLEKEILLLDKQLEKS